MQRHRPLNFITLPMLFPFLMLSACDSPPGSDGVGAGILDATNGANLNADSILDFLNGPDATEEALHDEVHLRAPVPQNIVTHVRGGDGVLGTDDDDLIDDLDELDAIPGVGPRTMEAIEAYARARTQANDVEIEGVSMSAQTAARMIALVNRVSEEVLDDEVGLDARAAHKIVAGRPIADVSALASLGYVGETALVHLRDFVVVRDDESIEALPSQCSAIGLPMPGPGWRATDQRSPELGDDVSAITGSRISLAQGVQQLEQSDGAVIEAKLELDHNGALSLSLYPIDGLDKDAERAVFKEAAGDPGKVPFVTTTEIFSDREHLVRSSRDLTLVQLSTKSIGDAAMEVGGFVYWSIPTIERGRAGYGVYSMDPFTCESSYRFVDGDGPTESITDDVDDLGEGPGPRATDARVPELGDDLTVLRASTISMADALAQMQDAAGPAIEAKFELDHDGHLSLSIYPLADVSIDPEHAIFKEAAGDPTATRFSPTTEVFADDDVEHQTRSARDLTLVQTADLTLAQAVDIAQAQVPDGIVYWAIPTLRDVRAGFGVYVLDENDTAHYFFVD